MTSDIIVAIIGGASALLVGITAAYFGYRQVKVKQQVKETDVKTEKIKIKAETETKRIDQVLDGLKDYISLLEKRVDKTEDKYGQVLKKMEACFEERLELKLKVQNVEAGQIAIKETMKKNGFHHKENKVV